MNQLANRMFGQSLDHFGAFFDRQHLHGVGRDLGHLLRIVNFNLLSLFYLHLSRKIYSYVLAELTKYNLHCKQRLHLFS